MNDRDPRVDAYIGRAAMFARPILEHLRKRIHAVCPDVEECIKWGMPHFLYHGILCNMAAFKAHCAFGFWKGSRLLDDAVARKTEAMGQFGRICSLADLPSDRVLDALIRKAMRLNVEDRTAPSQSRSTTRKPPPAVPTELAEALRTNAEARAAFDGFSPTHRREYCEWITDAKREETRARRIEQAVAWLSEGKSRHWKHQS